MFASAPSPAARAQSFSQFYRQVAVQSAVDGDADSHRMISMLFDGFFEAVAEARGALRAKEVERKGRAIGRAARIVEEGLRASLNLTEGGKVARDLHQLYGYIGLRLTQANLRNDEAALDECVALVTPVQEAWKAIKPAGGN
jgi:flagellar protein FliS